MMTETGAEKMRNNIAEQVRRTGIGVDVTMQVLADLFPDESPTMPEVIDAVWQEIRRPAGGRPILEGRTTQRQKIQQFCAEHGLTTMEVALPSGIPVLRFCATGADVRERG